MKHRILVFAAIVVGIALAPATAWAKGAKDVTISGPGLNRPVTVENTVGPHVVEVNRLAEATGLFYAAFRTKPSPMTRARPAGRLGPRYRAVYELYASEATTVTIRQDIYPFAAAGFASYTPPGQRALDKTATSGWYVTSDTTNTGIDGRRATGMLVALGVLDRHARDIDATREVGTPRRRLLDV